MGGVPFGENWSLFRNQLISKNAAFFNPHSNTTFGSNSGLGWQVYYEDPGKINGFGHNGSWGGFRTNYYYDHATGRTTILLSNRSDFDGDEVWEELTNIIERFQK